MKKIFIALCFFAITPIICSERSWLRSKVDAFAKQLVTRHTYEYNSWEHKRDRALLCLLPAKTSQMVLQHQRYNMVMFLKQNEKNALQDVKNYFNLDNQRFEKILKSFNEEHNFNLNAMMHNSDHKGIHDENLPVELKETVSKIARQHSINSKNLDLQITTKPNALAQAGEKRPLPPIYNPAYIEFNAQLLSQYDLKLFHTIRHELTHVILGHSLLATIFSDEVVNKNEINKLKENLAKQSELLSLQEEHLQSKLCSPFRFFYAINPFNSFSAQYEELELNQRNYIENMENLIKLQSQNIELLDDYIASSQHKSWVAAREKTADTYYLCKDKQAAEDAFNQIMFMQEAKVESYPENHNDMKVIHANWQTSQAITNFQQLKNSITQKLNVFPKPFV